MTGLRERKKADTRRALSDAALQLAFQRGLDAVTREEIATMAGVSLRTFNNYFAGKYEALAYRLAERTRHNISEFRARPADEPLWTSIAEALVAPTEDELATLTGSRAGSRVELAEVRKLFMMAEIRNAIPHDLFEEWVTAIAAKTGTDPELDTYPRLVGAVLRAVGDATMEAYAKADPPVSYAELLRANLASVAAGLPEPRRKP